LIKIPEIELLSGEGNKMAEGEHEVVCLDCREVNNRGLPMDCCPNCGSDKIKKKFYPHPGCENGNDGPEKEEEE
jgi:hypothetical protein